jgi:RNA polymerase sigma factor (TIGR02999 family)
MMQSESGGNHSSGGVMGHASTHEISRLLRSWSEGDALALDALVPLVYDELHQLAHHYMRREGRGHVLQTTAVIHEAFLRLTRSKPADWEDRTHFFGICARLMRQILVDFARSEQAQKRGGDAVRLGLEDAPRLSAELDTDLLALDEALTSLSRLDERKGRIVELRFFGGLSVEETAEVLKVSPDTVTRDWRLARAWLLKEMSDGR